MLTLAVGLYFDFSPFTDTTTTMFVNILPQREWIRLLLLGYDVRFKLWSRDEGIITRNSGFSITSGNIFVLFFFLILSYHVNYIR